jgi:hypothetical protein
MYEEHGVAGWLPLMMWLTQAVLLPIATATLPFIL